MPRYDRDGFVLGQLERGGIHEAAHAPNRRRRRLVHVRFDPKTGRGVRRATPDRAAYPLKRTLSDTDRPGRPTYFPCGGRYYFPVSSRSRRVASPTVGGLMHAVLKRSEEHTSELQSHVNLVCRLLLEKKKKKISQCQQQIEVLLQRTH